MAGARRHEAWMVVLRGMAGGGIGRTWPAWVWSKLRSPAPHWIAIRSAVAIAPLSLVRRGRIRFGRFRLGRVGLGPVIPVRSTRSGRHRCAQFGSAHQHVVESNLPKCHHRLVNRLVKHRVDSAIAVVSVLDVRAYRKRHRSRFGWSGNPSLRSVALGLLNRMIWLGSERFFVALRSLRLVCLLHG